MSEARREFARLCARNRALLGNLAQPERHTPEKLSAMRAEVEANRARMKLCGRVFARYRTDAAQDRAEERRQRRRDER